MIDLEEQARLEGSARYYGGAPPQARGFGQVADASNAMGDLGGYKHQNWSGEKFAGGIGPLQHLTVDYYTACKRSEDLFTRNLFAAGLIDCLVSNTIVSGLYLESMPRTALLDVSDDEASAWSELVEEHFSLWGEDRETCDAEGECTLGELQERAKRDALICGGVLVVLIPNQQGLPQVKLIKGPTIRTPFANVKLTPGHKIKLGVELDANRRHVAYWVLQEETGDSERIPAYDQQGRRTAWLVHGTPPRAGEVRSIPMLTRVIQSLNELDKYRDSVQRKAAVNSFLAMWVEKTQDKVGSLALGASAVGAVRADAQAGPAQIAGPRTFDIAEYIPGLVVQELQHGEKIHAHNSTGTDASYGSFEEAILAGVAMTYRVPPEVLLQKFASNFSASKAALNEFELVMYKDRTRFGSAFCAPIYEDWLLSSALLGHIDAPQLVRAFFAKDRRTMRAWTASDWCGQLKPTLDPDKMMRGFNAALAAGGITRDRVSRQTSGMKFSRVVKQRLKEDQMMSGIRGAEPFDVAEPTEPENEP